MSYMVARMEKMKVGNLGGAYRHNERIFKKHSNKDIDVTKSHLNYELTERDRSISYERQIKNYVNENKISNRAIRKDAVLCDEWMITSDKAFFEKLSDEQTRAFFETAKNYFAENYGDENIAYASVHLDETTPHMHMGIVPFQNGKLSSKAMFGKKELKKIQEDLPNYMIKHGFEVERGELNSEKKHKTVAEFKQEIAAKEFEKDLVLQYGAPEYVNHLGEFVSKEDYQEAYKEFQEYLGDFFGEESFSWRETTFEEKLDWVKNHQQEELQKLERSKTPLEDDIRALNEILREKYEELEKIELRASESFSELSEAERYIDALKNRSKALETKLEGLENANLKLVKQNSDLLELKVMSESELAEIKPQKNFLGKERVEMTVEQFQEFKGLVYSNKNLAHHQRIELETLKERMPLKHAKNSFEASLERAKEKSKGESIERLRSENRALKNENSVLRQQNDKMLGKLRELMPDKALKQFVSELKAIQPIVKIVQRVIEKGLGL